MNSPAPEHPSLNLLREELPLPAAVIYQTRLENNLRWMQTFAEARGVALAPHGKTTMTPHFFQLQQAAGAWGMSLATVAQVQVAAQAGIKRIILANQLVGRQNMQLVSELLATHGELDFYCLVDSQENVKQLGEFFFARNQSLQVLLEIGVPGGRCGCRNDSEVERLCQAIAAQPALQLTGAETYEGLIHGENTVPRIKQHLIWVRDLTLSLLQQQRFARHQVILTAAGSAWYDLVADIFTQQQEPRLLPILRPGCYLIHDQGIYLEAQHNVMQRLAANSAPEGDLLSSLEVWAYVQSQPEPGMAILTLGKRDAAFDAGLPQPVLHYRPGSSVAPRATPKHWQLTRIMDQHSIMQFSPDADIRVGDIIALSTSHPCLTFDKWRQLYLIDDNYNLLQTLPTYF